MKKHIMALALVLALALSTAACGTNPPPVSAPAASSAAAGAGSIKGTVADATMNTVTIQVPNGSEYTFPTEGVEVSGSDGLLLGDEITIQYTGTFDEGNQVQQVTVTAINVDTEGPNHTTGQPAAAAPTGDVKSLEGVIDEYDGGDTMLVADATGVDFLFPLAGADLHVGEEGFKVGDNVIVYYYGELVDNPDLQNVTVGEVKLAD